MEIVYKIGLDENLTNIAVCRHDLQLNESSLNDIDDGQVDIKGRVIVHSFLTFPIDELVACLITSSNMKLKL